MILSKKLDSNEAGSLREEKKSVKKHNLLDWSQEQLVKNATLY